MGDKSGRDFIIVGNVLGDHKIADIGVTIKYGQSIRLSHEQVLKSKDLAKDIEKNRVVADTKGKSLPPMRQSVFGVEIKNLTSAIGLNTYTSGNTANTADASSLKQVMEQNTNILKRILSSLEELNVGVKELKVVSQLGSASKMTDVIKEIADGLRQSFTHYGSETPMIIGEFQRVVQTEDVQFIPEKLIPTGLNTDNIKVNSEKKSDSAITDKASALKKARGKK